MENLQKRVLLISLIILILPAVISITIAIGTDWMTTEPEWIIFIEEYFLDLKKLPFELIVSIGQIIPGLLGVVIYKDSISTRLDKYSKTYLVILIIGLLTAFMSILFFDIEKHGVNISVGEENELISMLINYNTDILKFTLIYIFSIIGLNYDLNNIFNQSPNALE